MGHGLNYWNVRPVVRIAGVEELNIGHSIVSRAVLVGMERAVREMKRVMQEHWPNPHQSSATHKPAELTGSCGLKMLGPYEWVPPNYWLEDTKRGGRRSRSFWVNRPLSRRRAAAG